MVVLDHRSSAAKTLKKLNLKSNVLLYLK